MGILRGCVSSIAEAGAPTWPRPAVGFRLFTMKNTTGIAGFLAALFLFLGAGCTHLGVGGFAPGVTTEAEIRARLGTFCHMILVGPDGRVREIRQAFSEDNFRRVVAGLTQDQVRRLLGGPEEKVRFALKPDEEVWSWRYEDTSEKTSYLNAYFGKDGRVLRADRSVVYKASGPSFP